MTGSRKILVTGGAGYLGNHVVNLLQDRCIVYDNLLYTNEYMKPVEFVYADVNDHKMLKSYLDRVDCVVWLAAIVGDAACMVNPSEALATNQEAIKFLADNYDGRIIFMSSCSTYGVNDAVATEESALTPQSLYAETKIRGEEILKGKDALILRLGTLHGVSERMRFDLVVNVLTRNAILKKKIEVFGGKQWRPLLSVKDAAAFIASMVDFDWPAGVYNLAAENLAITDVASIVAKRIPDVKVEIVGTQFEDRRNYRVDVSKAQKVLGFEPSRKVDGSVREIADLIRSRRIKDFSDIRFANLTALQHLNGRIDR